MKFGTLYAYWTHDWTGDYKYFAKKVADIGFDILEISAGDLITMSDKHSMRNKVDHVIWLPNYKNQGYPQYLESQVVFMVFVDLLTSHIAQLYDR